MTANITNITNSKFPKSISRGSLLLLFCLLFGINSSRADSIPRPDHIVILVLENHSYKQVIGTPFDSFINTIADSGALFTKMYAETHPSQPNYLILFSGSNQGVKDDMTPSHLPFMTQNLASSLILAKHSFTGYAESLPHLGYTGNDSLSAYSRRHCPWVNWQGIGPNQIDSIYNRPFLDFPTNFKKLPTVSFVIPNTTHDMHDGTGTKLITTCDNWVMNNLGNYIKWVRSHNSLLIITFDEDDDKSKNHIATIFYGAQVVPGKYNDSLNHYNILGTIQKMYGLKAFGDSAKSKTVAIRNCWDTGQFIIDTTTHKDTTTKDTTITSINKMAHSVNINVYPVPTADKIYFTGLESMEVILPVRVYDPSGKLIMTGSISPKQNSMDLSHLPNGTYFLEMKNKDTLVRKKIVLQR